MKFITRILDFFRTAIFSICLGVLIFIPGVDKYGTEAAKMILTDASKNVARLVVVYLAAVIVMYIVKYFRKNQAKAVFENTDKST